jgi:hypothetical protein
MSVETLDRFVQQVVSQVRWRRAEHYGLRGAFYGALGAVVVLISETLGFRPPAAAGVFVLGTVSDGRRLKKVPVADAARLADRAWLHERVATSIEGELADRSPLGAPVADTMNGRRLPADRSSVARHARPSSTPPPAEPGARAGPGCSVPFGCPRRRARADKAADRAGRPR